MVEVVYLSAVALGISFLPVGVLRCWCLERVRCDLQDGGLVLVADSVGPDCNVDKQPVHAEAATFVAHTLIDSLVVETLAHLTRESLEQLRQARQ